MLPLPGFLVRSKIWRLHRLTASETKFGKSQERLEKYLLMRNRELVNIIAILDSFNDTKQQILDASLEKFCSTVEVVESCLQDFESRVQALDASVKNLGSSKLVSDDYKLLLRLGKRNLASCKKSLDSDKSCLIVFTLLSHLHKSKKSVPAKITQRQIVLHH